MGSLLPSWPSVFKEGQIDVDYIYRHIHKV